MEYLNKIIRGDCLSIIPKLPDKSISLCVTSPPYAQQRVKHYQGVSEENYPEWTVKWMEVLRPKLKDDGSVFIIIRPHIKNGQISDYTLHTRLALRNKNWIECEELIWHKPDGPPLGSCYRPRRTWESIHWFAKTTNPFVDLRACGNTKSSRTGGFQGSNRFGEGGDSPLAACQNRQLRKGTSRCGDVVRVPVAKMSKGVMHPAMFPPDLSDFLVQTFSTEGDTVIDPFAGSCTVGVSSRRHGRQYCCIELEESYVAEGHRLLEKEFFD